MADDKIFADGFVFKRSEKAPDFVVGRLSMKVAEAKAFLDTHIKNGWVNVNIKQARSGNFYVELDTYEVKNAGNVDIKPETMSTSTPPEGGSDDDEGDLPF